ncbi:Melanopsin-A Mammalian-like melanopsin Melanopsin-M Opsin-4-A Opsin-4M [Channa argus]|uniref:Melanopsin-A Mammalian-like melanopsin Melanopsin-M Opsin-4-A Opsin-4M n=1 Tax=Channa argus TaxID=215402 RepID=A0A6G1R010_CHAAH|nr:Melanopsin-A Mammalian-like melanopsin Melanopsin-M Opsin-4-A Opsin-4M [Channa argus]
MSGGRSALLPPTRQSVTGIQALSAASAWSGNGSAMNAHGRLEPQTPASAASTVAMAPEDQFPFPTVDVPDHAHYIIGSIILVIGITGMVGNFLVIYAFTSMHKRWIFGEKACELYAFCGALFGICSMITLTVIAVDRYFVITRPLTSIGVLSRKRAFLILVAAWVYSLGWSLPPFFGWSAYVPEGLMTSCTWDYMTFTPSVRAYTMLLFVFVFFLPLFIIIYCYVFIFRAIRTTNQAVGKVNGSVHGHGSSRDSVKSLHRLQNEWKMAKIALIVILLYVISWSPYSTVALTAFAGYADMLTPYMNSVPAIIAKASAIHNPIIYAITHPKYRIALAKYIPCLGVLLCVRPRDLRSASSSFMSTRRSTVTSQSSDFRRQSTAKSRLSSFSDSESGLTDIEADLSSMGSRLASRQVSCDISRDTAEIPEFKASSSIKSKMKSHDSGIFERSGDCTEGHVMRGALSRIPSIVITSESSPFLPIGRSGSHTARSKISSINTETGSR